MGRTAGRSPEQTRRLVLDATADVIRERGVGATLDDIADAAGVSKGGLLYHFGTKDALLLALAGSFLDDFRTAVQHALDPSDTTPGRLIRAYLLVSLDPETDERAVRDNLVLLAQLISDDQVAALAAEDHRRWTEDLIRDGLPDEVRELVLAAADGAGMAAIWGGLVDRAAILRLRDRLMTITRDRQLWAALAAAATTPVG